MTRRKKIAVGCGGGLLALLAGLAAVAGYLVATGESRLQFAETEKPPLRASSDPEMIERGRYLVHGPAHCSQCHSTSEREHPEKIRTAPLTGGLEFAMGPIGRRYAPNLTPDPETGIGRYGDEELARAVRAGVLPDGSLSFFMRYAAAQPSDEDLVAILSYLRSLAPVRNEVPRGEWYALGKLMLPLLELGPRVEPAPRHVPYADDPSVERGEYLAEHLMLCVLCHSQVEEGTFQRVGPKAGGSFPQASHGSDKDKEFVAPNLTSHETGRTGQLTEDEFLARLRAGRFHASSIMPWENIQDVTDADLRSIYRYLRSLPPVDNDVGPTYRDLGWQRP